MSLKRTEVKWFYNNHEFKTCTLDMHGYFKTILLPYVLITVDPSGRAV